MTDSAHPGKSIEVGEDYYVGLLTTDLGGVSVVELVPAEVFQASWRRCLAVLESSGLGGAM